MKYIGLLITTIGLLAIGCGNPTANNKYNKGQEISVLKELRSDLIQNLDDINANIESLDICVTANLIIINQIESQLAYHDSLDYHFANLYPYIIFSPNQTTYDHLKQIGLTIISNDSIRSAVSNLYGAQYGLYASFEKIYFVEHYTNYIKPMFMAEFDTFEFYRSFKPRDYNQFISNKSYKSVLRYTIDASRSFIMMQSGLKSAVTQLISDIDKELQ